MKKSVKTIELGQGIKRAGRGERRGLIPWSLAIALGMGLLIGNSPARAAVIVGVTATASTTGPNYSPTWAVDGTGLDGLGQHTQNDYCQFTAWQSNASWYQGADDNPWFLVDLGAVYDITSFHVWNHNGGGGASSHGITSALITYATSNPAGTGNTLGTYSFAQAPGLPDYTGEDFTASFTARYVLLDILGTYDDLEGNYAYGLSEIQFTGTAAVAVPEPSAVALLALGGLFIWKPQRRKSIGSIDTMSPAWQGGKRNPPSTDGKH